MKDRILTKVEEAFKKAETFYGRTFSRPKHIIFKKTGTTAGHCNYRKSELMFQISMAEYQPDDFISRTPDHEVAHWIDKEQYGYQYTNSRRIIHGKTWRYIMERVMKIDSSRCHSYDTSNVSSKRQERFDYSCECGQEIMLSKTRHNWIVKGKKSYSCAKCRRGITLNVKTKEQQIEELQQQLTQLKQQHTTRTTR
tara:strand:+ start:1165 stop:1752 length:588 start_codon:yes stop_codon:yes gene_type:complete